MRTSSLIPPIFRPWPDLHFSLDRNKMHSAQPESIAFAVASGQILASVIFETPYSLCLLMHVVCFFVSIRFHNKKGTFKVVAIFLDQRGT